MTNKFLHKIILISAALILPTLPSCGGKSSTTPTPTTTTPPSPYNTVGQAVGSEIAGPNSSLSLKVYSGIPYLAYIGSDSYAHVKKYDTGTSDWADVGTSATSSATSFVRLEIDSSGNPFIVYIDSALNTVKVKEFISGSWTADIGGSLGTALSTATAPAIAIYQNNPIIAFIDSSTKRVSARIYNGSSWSAAKLISDGVADDASLYVDSAASTATGYIAYRDGSASNAISVKEYIVGSPSATTLGTLGFSTGTATYITIALDSNGIPFVSYRDASLQKAVSMKYVSGAWTAVGTSISDGDAGYVSMFVYSTRPTVCYQDAANSNKITYKYSDETSWYTSTTEGFSTNTVTETAIFVDSTEMYIAYIDSISGGIIVQKF